jgi:hypothetical protein
VENTSTATSMADGSSGIRALKLLADAALAPLARRVFQENSRARTGTISKAMLCVKFCHRKRMRP